MAVDKKIADLNAFTELNVDADFLVGVDDSDTTDSSDGTTKKLILSLLKSAMFAMYEVTNAQRLAGTRGDGSTPLVSGDYVKVTDQGDRIEQLLDDSDASDNANWLVVENSFQLYIFQASGSAVNFTIAGQSAVSVPNGLATAVGWVKYGTSVTSAIGGSPTPSFGGYSIRDSSSGILRAGTSIANTFFTNVIATNFRVPFEGPPRGQVRLSTATSVP